MAEIADGTARAGITDFGVADHLHSCYNLPDIAAARGEFLASRPSPRFHFGVEVTCMRRWELAEVASGRHENPVYGIEGGPDDRSFAIDLTDDDVKAHGIEFVIGAVHWARGVRKDRTAIIDNYLHQYLSLASHPLVDIIAHPWWWNGWYENEDGSYTTEPWFHDFGVIPRSVHDELAAALIGYGKAVEINPGVLVTRHYPEAWRKQYLEYLGELAALGVQLAAGSDRHQRPYENRFEEMEPLLESVGIRDEDLWRLPPRVERVAGSSMA